MQFNIEIIDNRHFVSSEFRGEKTFAIRGVYLLTVCKMSVEEKLRKLRGKRTLEILVNSRRGKNSRSFAESGESAWSVLYIAKMLILSLLETCL